jgi:hypothetical protein
MGREVRRVPPNWIHPVIQYFSQDPNSKRCYFPMYEESYEVACEEWIKGFEEWKKNKREKHFYHENEYYWDWNGMPPDRQHYNTYYTKEQATWYQVYETVSEGTPLTPPFETQQELVDYLVEHGTFWSETGISRNAAENFVYKNSYVPSMTLKDGKITTGINQCDEEGKDEN